MKSETLLVKSVLQGSHITSVVPQFEKGWCKESEVIGVALFCLLHKHMDDKVKDYNESRCLHRDLLTAMKMIFLSVNKPRLQRASCFVCRVSHRLLRRSPAAESVPRENRILRDLLLSRTATSVTRCTKRSLWLTDTSTACPRTSSGSSWQSCILTRGAVIYSGEVNVFNCIKAPELHNLCVCVQRREGRDEEEVEEPL